MKSNIKKRFAKYVIQSSLGMIGISIYIIADTFFISLKAGTDGITVLNLVLPLYGIIYAIGNMIALGSATRFAIHRAQGRESSEYFFHALAWQLIISVPFILIGIIAPEAYLHLMGADETITAIGVDYTRIVFIGAPFFMTNYTFTSFARNDNAPTKAMVASICGSMFNIVFDYVLMFPLNMGLAGAALATALSPVVTSAVTMTHFLSKKCTIKFKPVALSFKRLFQCMKLGFSAFVSEISSAVTTIVFNTILLIIVGNTGVAAYGVVANFALVVVAIFNGIAQGCQPLFSESYGKGDHKQTMYILRLGLTVTIIVELIIVGAVFAFTDPLVALFNSEQNTVLAEYAFTGMRLYFLGFLLGGINIYMINFYSSTEKALEAFVVSILRGVAAITVCAIIMAIIFGINGVWLSFATAEVITFTVICFISRKLLKKSKIKYQE